MKTINHTKNTKKIEVDKDLDKYENHPLPFYKTERAIKNLTSVREIVKQVRERMHPGKSGELSKEI